MRYYWFIARTKYKTMRRLVESDGDHFPLANAIDEILNSMIDGDEFISIDNIIEISWQDYNYLLKKLNE